MGYDEQIAKKIQVPAQVVQISDGIPPKVDPIFGQQRL